MPLTGHVTHTYTLSNAAIHTSPSSALWTSGHLPVNAYQAFILYPSHVSYSKILILLNSPHPHFASHFLLINSVAPNRDNHMYSMAYLHFFMCT
jgi:hypothetical protein